MNLSCLLTLCVFLLSCVTTVIKPCTQGGQASRDQLVRFNKRCYQKKDSSGNYINHGPYVEWYPDGSLALEGHYRDGRKDGKWTEWALDGKKVTEKYYDHGIEVPSRTATAISPPNTPSH